MTFNCTLTLDRGAAVTPVALRGLWFEIREGLSELTDIQVEIVLPAGLPPSVILGLSAHLHVSRGSATPPDQCIRYGVVTAVEHVGDVREHSLFRVELTPRIGLLRQRVHCRAFTDATVKTIVEEVVKDAGLDGPTALLWRAGAGEPRNLCVQFRETDFDFICRLLEDEGLAYRFSLGKSAEVFEVFDDESGRCSDPVRPLLTESIVGRDAAFELRPTGVTFIDWDHRKTHDHRVRAVAREPVGVGVVVDRRDVEVYPGRHVCDTGTLSEVGAPEEDSRLVAQQSEAERRSQRRLQAERVRSESARLIGNWLGINPGALVRDDAGRLYCVTRVEQGSTRLAPTNLDEDTYSRQMVSTVLEVMPSSRWFRPPLRTPRPVVSGLQSAVVVGDQPGGVSTDRLGRVHLAFAWESSSAEAIGTNRCWVRTLSGPWAGPGWGHQFIPRVGMEVAVSFMDGDPDRPVIVGALFNNDSPLPYEPEAHPLRNGVRSHSSSAGEAQSELFFDDAPGDELVHIGSKRDLSERVAREHRVDVKADQLISVGGKRHSTVERDDEAVVNGSHKTDVKGRVHVTAGQEFRAVVGSSECLLKPGTAQTSAPKSVELSCGDTKILITPNSIVLQTSGARLELQGASIKLDAATVASKANEAVVEAKTLVSIQGNLVKINS